MGGFRMYINPEQFLNRVYVTSRLERIIKDVDAIVSPRDIVPKCLNGELLCRVELMSKNDIESILRSVTDGKGREVYQKAEIGVGRITPNLTNYVQTFVQVDKLIKLNEFVKFLSYFNYTGIKEVRPLMILYNDDKQKFIAFYFPPIMETTRREQLWPIINSLRERINEREESEIILPGYFGDVALDLKIILKYNTGFIDKGNGDIHYIRDGVHRSYIAWIAGTTVPVISIRGSEAIPTGALLPINWIIVTRQKPKKKENRFLGYIYDTWLNYHEIGIDG